MFEVVDNEYKVLPRGDNNSIHSSSLFNLCIVIFIEGVLVNRMRKMRLFV